MSLCYDITWRIQFPSQAETLARVRLAFPSLGAVQSGSCHGTLAGRVVVPALTAAAGSPIVAGTCALARESGALHFHASLPFAAAAGPALISLQCLTFANPKQDSLAHVRLEGDGIGTPRVGQTLLHLPHFVAQLSTSESDLESDLPAHGLARALAAFATWPSLRLPIVQAGRLLRRNHFGLPPDTLVFLRAAAHSAEQLEVLLLLHQHAGRDWSPEQVARYLAVPPDAVTRSLRRLATRRLLSQQGDAPIAFRFAPEDPQAWQATARLAHCYAQRRVAVLTAIARGPVDDVQSFADAFRWRAGDGG